MKLFLFFQKFFFLFIETIKVLLKSNLFLRDLKPLKKNKKNELILLANGPSLKAIAEKLVDNRFAHGKDIMVVNDFPLSDLYEKIKPKILVLVDTGYWRPINEIQEAKTVTMSEAINKKTNWPLYLLIPKYADLNAHIFSNISNSNVNFIKYNNTPVLKTFNCYKYWLYNKNLASPSSQNVTIIAEYLSVFLGYENISIFGLDHNWLELLTLKNNVLYLSDSHFFEANGDNTLRKLQFTIAKYMHIMYKVFTNHELIKQYADSKNIKIINFTDHSWVDAFEFSKL